MLLGYRWSSTLSIPMMSLLPWTTSCLTSPGLLSDGVLILGSLLLNSLRLLIFSLGYHVIPCGLSLIWTPFFWKDVRFCMLLLLMLLGYRWSNTLSILMMSLLPWTTSCLTSPGLLSEGVLILESLLLSSVRLPIFSLG